MNEGLAIIQYLKMHLYNYGIIWKRIKNIDLYFGTFGCISFDVILPLNNNQFSGVNVQNIRRLNLAA